MTHSEEKRDNRAITVSVQVFVSPKCPAAVIVGWLSVETVIPAHYVPGSDDVDEFTAELASRAGDDAPTVVELSAGEQYKL